MMDETVATAPQVTIQQVNAAICYETYTVLPNGRTTICQLTLDNGFTVEGSSACVSIENFDPAKGNKYSRERAVEKVWQILGFRLCDQLTQNQNKTDVQDLAVDPVRTFDGPTPQLGDQVHYFEQIEGAVTEPMLAWVTSVLSKDQVSLGVFAPNGTGHARDRVFLVNLLDEPRPDLHNFARLKS